MASYLINKVLRYLGWKRAEAEEHDDGEQASTKAEEQNASEQTLVETEKHDEDEQTSTKAEKQDAGEQVLLEAEKHNESEQASMKVEKQDAGELALTDVGKRYVGEQASAKAEKQDAGEQALVEAEKHNEGKQASTKAEKHDAGELALTEVEKRCVGEQASAKSTTRYEYLKLDPGMIRLIRILPSSGDDDPIKCEITFSPIYLFYPTNILSYGALSYEWADARNIKKIILDGKTFHIRENLWHALRCLRRPQARILWIDAICIDQNNISERNHQVSQMGNIYRNARQVIIWLGMESPSSWNAFSCIRGYSRAPISWLTAIADNSWEAFVELCDRSYWHRLWIIQEVVLEKELEIHCGNSQLHWEELVKVCKNLSSIPELDGDPPIFKKVRKNIVFHLIRLREARGMSKTTLRELLETCEKSLCADPRDKIYGLLGLADDIRGPISADYSKSLFDIYKDVIHFQRGIDFGSIVSFSQFLQWYLWHGADGNQGDCTAYLRLEASQRVASYIISAPGLRRGTVFSLGPIFGGTAETRKAWISAVASRFSCQGSDFKKQAVQLVASYHENETTEMNRAVYLNGFASNGLLKPPQWLELLAMQVYDTAEWFTGRLY
jgi:hypothetical protein